MKNLQITSATCPNCWGHQEYAGTVTEIMSSRTPNDEEPHFIRRFVEQHLPNIQANPPTTGRNV